DRGQYVNAGRGAGPDEQRSPAEPAELEDGLASALGGVDDLRGVWLEDAAGLGQRDRAALAYEQIGPELRLELAHVLGQRGLRQMDLLGGDAEALLPSHGEEHFALPERHSALPISAIQTSY